MLVVSRCPRLDRQSEIISREGGFEAETAVTIQAAVRIDAQLDVVAIGGGCGDQGAFTPGDGGVKAGEVADQLQRVAGQAEVLIAHQHLAAGFFTRHQIPGPDHHHQVVSVIEVADNGQRGSIGGQGLHLCRTGVDINEVTTVERAEGHPWVTRGLRNFSTDIGVTAHSEGGVGLDQLLVDQAPTVDDRSSADVEVTPGPGRNPAAVEQLVEVRTDRRVVVLGDEEDLIAVKTTAEADDVAIVDGGGQGLFEDNAPLNVVDIVVFAVDQLPTAFDATVEGITDFNRQLLAADHKVLERQEVDRVARAAELVPVRDRALLSDETVHREVGVTVAGRSLCAVLELPAVEGTRDARELGTGDVGREVTPENLTAALLHFDVELALRRGFVSDGRIITKGGVGAVVVDPVDQLRRVLVEEIGKQLADTGLARIRLRGHEHVSEQLAFQETGEACVGRQIAAQLPVGADQFRRSTRRLCAYCQVTQSNVEEILIRDVDVALELKSAGIFVEHGNGDVVCSGRQQLFGDELAAAVDGHWQAEHVD